MKAYIAEVRGEDYQFDVNAVDDHDAHATAVEYLQLIGMEEWIDRLTVSEK